MTGPASHLRVVGVPDIADRADTVAELAGTYQRMTADLAAMVEAEAERSARAAAVLRTALDELREELARLAARLTDGRGAGE